MSVPAISQPASSVLWRGWPPWAWVALVVAALIGSTVVGFFGLLIAVSAGSACDQDPDPANVADAQDALVVLTVVAVGPWLVTSIWVRRRLRLLLAALVCAAPAFALLVEGAVNSDSYSLSWCFG